MSIALVIALCTGSAWISSQIAEVRHRVGTNEVRLKEDNDRIENVEKAVIELKDISRDSGENLRETQRRIEWLEKKGQP